MFNCELACKFICIKSSNASEIRRCAEQIFVMSGEKALLESGYFFPRALEKFSKVIVYVENVSKLTENEIHQMNLFAAHFKNVDVKFIVGIESLSQLNVLPQESKELLSKNLFDMERLPKFQKTSSDVLELLFFKTGF